MLSKRLSAILKNQGGFSLLITVLIVFALGAMGITLAASSAANFNAHKTFERLEKDYYGADGAMTYVLAVLERAAAAGREYAYAQSEAAYSNRLAIDGIPPTNQELEIIFRDAFQHYVVTGSGKNYINEQLGKMKTDEQFLAEAVVDWGGAAKTAGGIRLSVKSNYLGRQKQVESQLLLPFDYVLQPEKEYYSGGTNTFPIGHYNPLLRAAITMNSFIRIDNGAGTIRADGPNGIAIQWTDNISTAMVSFDNTLHVYGYTLPILQRSFPRTIRETYQALSVNGISVDRTRQYPGVPPVNLAQYYDKSYMPQIVRNDKSRSWETNNNFFSAKEGDYVLHIYPGNSYDNHDWSRYSGKKGLIIFEDKLTAYTNYGSQIKFQGAILVLGKEESRSNVPVDLTYDAEAVEKAIALYKKETGKDTLEKMFKLDTLMTNPTQPESYTRKNIISNEILNKPLVISNQKVTTGGINSYGTRANLLIENSKMYISGTSNSTKGIQTPTGSLDVETKYIQSGLFWNNASWVANDKKITINDVGNSGNIFDKIDANVIRDMLRNNIPYYIEEEGHRDGNYLMLIHTGDVTLEWGNLAFTDGTPREPLSGKRGILFINGKLTILQQLDFRGVIIATNGIYAKDGGNVRIQHDPEAALHALNLANRSVSLFDTGNNTEEVSFSIYDGEPSGSGSPIAGAADSGNVVYKEKGVVIEKWRIAS